jgi:hypothetical protein
MRPCCPGHGRDGLDPNLGCYGASKYEDSPDVWAHQVLVSVPVEDRDAYVLRFRRWADLSGDQRALRLAVALGRENRRREVAS